MHGTIYSKEETTQWCGTNIWVSHSELPTEEEQWDTEFEHTGITILGNSINVIHVWHDKKGVCVTS